MRTKYAGQVRIGNTFRRRGPNKNRPLPVATEEDRQAAIMSERRIQVRTHCPRKDTDRCQMLDGAICFDERCETDCQRPYVRTDAQIAR